MGRAPAGLALIALSAIGWISIITWSNIDPSLTHTTSEPTRNLLGPFGAIVSDLLLQTLGVGALFVLGGPLAWGLELASARRVPMLARKLVVFPIAILVLAGGLSGMPTLPSWPLHHGFGGLLGDLIFNMVYSLLVIVSADRAGLLAGLMLLSSGLAVLVHGLGCSIGDLVGGATARLPYRRGEQAADEPPSDFDAEADEDTDDEQPSAHEPAFDTMLVATRDAGPDIAREPLLAIDAGPKRHRHQSPARPEKLPHVPSRSTSSPSPIRRPTCTRTIQPSKKRARLPAASPRPPPSQQRLQPLPRLSPPT